MQTPRTLALTKETLAELTSAELGAVVAAQASGKPCELTDTVTGTLCFPTCGPMCTGTSTTGVESSLC